MTPSTPADHWIYVGWGYVFYGLIVLILFLAGEHGEERNPLKIFFRRISWSLERATGCPGWAMAGALTALHGLGVAVVGLYWDVAFHIDFGRDKELFTPSHTMIVLGLGGLIFAAGIAVLFASLDRAPVELRVGPVRVPWSAVALAALGVGGVVGFPLDNLWHEAYGVDVTLWSPTHLQLIAGGSLAPIVVWLMLREGSPGAAPTLLGRGITALSLGAVVAGMTTVQGEFVFGVPQFQVAYLPILIAAAAGFSLVLARVALGPWGAVKAVFAYLIIKGLLALLVGGALNHTVPRFALYVGAALVVEAAAAALGTAPALRFGLVAGALAGTVGVAAELAWVDLSGWFPEPGSDLALKGVLLAPVAAVAAALLGAALGSRATGKGGVPLAVVPAAIVALAVAVGLPLPRNVGDVDAVVRLQRSGSEAQVEVELQPADAAEDATAFGIVAWQGGGRVQAGLRQVGPGRYVSTRTVPVTGNWKAVVGLQRDDEVMAAPVYLPADPEIGAPEIAALPERRAAFVRNTELLLRETHDGPAWPAFAAYGGLSLVLAVWIALFAVCASRSGRSHEVVRPSRLTTAESDEDRLDRWRAAMAAARH
jgi:hypothetical protein